MTDLTLLAALACGALLFLLARGRGRSDAPLQAAQAHGERFVESLPLLLWASDANGLFDYLSPQWLAYTGAPIAEQLGRGWLKHIHAEDLARVQAEWTRSVERVEPFDCELRLRRHDGAYLWFQARANPMRSEAGLVLRWVGSNVEIQTVKANAQAQLTTVVQQLQNAQSVATSLERVVAERNALAERLQLATSASQIGVWEWDIQAGRLSWDASMRRIYGFEQPDYQPTNESWGSAIHPEDHPGVRELLREVLAGRGQFRAMFRILRPNGEVRHVQADAVLTRDGVGRAQHMTGVNWDVTEQRVAELALREAEAMQRAILASAGSAIFTLDAETRLIRSFNRAAEELLGYCADEVVGKVTPELFHDPDELRSPQGRFSVEPGGTLMETIQRALESRPQSSEFRFVRKDGTRVSVLLTMSVIRDSAQHVLGYLGVVTDLTLHKQYEAELLSLNKLLEERTEQAESASHAKGMFLANMSHEIRTPIGAITGASYLLGRTTLSVEQQDLLSTIDRSATVLLGMVNDVLDLSKIEAQQLALDHERFELPAVLDDLASLMHAYASGKNIELILDVQQQLPSHFFGDRLRLTQVFSNLTVNAIKFTERGNVRVVVRAVEREAERTRLRFEVHDTGPGIDPELQARLFKPFSQAEQRGPRRYGGTGLGLAIVRELVTLMDGSVGLSSRPGVGSTFWCEIPLPHAPESIRPSVLGQELRVLIIEDYDHQRAALLRSAVRLGFRAVAAPSGEQGFQLLLAAAQEQRPFDIVLLDWQMPGIDGLQVLEQVRDAAALKQAQPAVILSTAYDLEALQAQPQSRLADAVVTKPIGPSSLMETVLRVVTARTPERVSRPVRRRPTATRKRLNGVRILVADDSDINRTIARRILELEGAKVSVASDGSEAVLMVTSGEHDVVLMDIQMPVEDGVDATSRIRADVRFATLPILALTAGALASERDRALAAGMTDFITKPYAADDLIERVLQYVEPEETALQPMAAEPAQAQWGAVEGFDVDAARSQLRGDGQLFRLLVTRLGQELAENPLEQQPCDLDICLSWLHRVGGSAGILCASGLHRRAKDGEIALHKGGEAELERVRDGLRDEIARTFRGIAAVASWAAPAKTSPEQGVQGQDDEALRLFTQCVHERDLQAFNMFPQVQPQLAARMGAAETQRLQLAIQGLDFAKAAEILRPLERSLGAVRVAQG